ncbi:MAG: hypothetical protein JRI23_17460 [Deltaproteobacteria bacterium]|jgi:hypothetical protein|nr:hypothetical protein [Deltaproteobacteria bacterium]MBW2533609.1 hypothetical protein [Deltaproteobacteria bacterium]
MTMLEPSTEAPQFLGERATPPVVLQCLLGAAAPPELGGNLASLLELPAAVLDSYAEVLEANLAPVIDDRVETRMKRYCRRYQIEPGSLAPSVKACRFLFTSAVRAGVDREAFIADVRALLPEEQATSVLDRLLPLFDEALPKMMQAAVFRSIAEHGKVVRAVRWRMDEIKASDHGMRLDVPVATITLQYQEGPNAGQTSYQLLPDQAAELQRALAHIVDGG